MSCLLLKKIIMKTVTFTQIGTFSVILFVPLFLVFTFVLIKTDPSDSADFNFYLFLSLVFLICLLTFYRLKIRIDEEMISFRLGIGFFGKKYKLSEVQSCQPVTNSWFYGIGIRFIPNGWLYNVSGLKAVELRFANKKSVVRIGTNKPVEICQLINSLKEKEAM